MRTLKIFTDKISRRTLLRSSLVLISVYPVKALLDLIVYGRANSAKQTRILSMDLPEGISFHEKIIAMKEGSRVVFFSSKCSHLGCQINRAVAGELVCPCHGSRFSKEGEVQNGPATKKLEQLSYTTDLSKQHYTIHLPE